MSILLSKVESRIYHHMKDHGSITQVEAYEFYGNTRLASTIHRMRNKGYDIKKEDVEVSNRFGEKRKIARYSL